MFKAGSSLAGKTAEDICFQDFKQFTVNDMVFGVGQLNSMSKEELQEVKEIISRNKGSFSTVSTIDEILR